MKTLLKALKVIFSLGILYVVSEQLGRDIGNLYLETHNLNNNK